MGTGRRGPGTYRPPKDMWAQSKRGLVWVLAGLVALIIAIWVAEWTIFAERPEP
ncbi:MAG TPA: hypothetical protein VM370_03975 [Candidatus Thermoplasmatota archaeon]|nr:hypothetical protein [Candidatus Thermoplasmatota archaeon]